MMNESPTEELEGEDTIWAAANIGIILFRASSKTLGFAKEWMAVLDNDADYWDQNAFNDLLHRGEHVFGREDRLFKAYNQTLLAGILPVTLFCSGQTYREEVWKRLGLHPYVVHATFQYSGTPGKRNRLREWGVWNDPPEYWEHEPGFVSYDNLVPEADLAAARDAERRDDVQGTLAHFRLINGQLRQLRNALVVAFELGGAATVFPHLWYGLDRWWAPHDGRIPGSLIQLPFQGPIDLALDLEQLEGRLPDGYREYSFLWKPEAKPLNASRLTVTICKDASDAACATGDEGLEPQDGEVSLLPGRTLNQVRSGLGDAFATFKLIYFKGNMSELLVLSGEEVERYNEMMSTWTSLHCCINEPVGHIWYDLFWDYPGHVDRFERKQEGPWIPIPGP